MGELMDLRGKRLIDRLQLFSRLEAHSFARRNVHLSAGARVAPDTSLARPDIEDSKAAQLNAFAMGQSLFHAAEYGLDRQFGFCLGDAGFVNHFVNDVELNHRSAPSS